MNESHADKVAARVTFDRANVAELAKRDAAAQKKPFTPPTYGLADDAIANLRASVDAPLTSNEVAKYVLGQIVAALDALNTK